jgi:hypothetical protein
MSRAIVLDPTAPPPETDPDPGPEAGPLAARRVGIRYDRTWRSFEWVVDEWTSALRTEGADVHAWCAGNRVGEEGERTREELGAFVDVLDIAVVGLGN